MIQSDNPQFEFEARIALHDAVLAQLVARMLHTSGDEKTGLHAFEEALVGFMATRGRTDKLDFSLDQAVWTREQHEYGKQIAHEFARTVEGYLQQP